nr:uncharacterized mitochondrial protein AtMg00810-like [Tanacetum cinerariifolium]
MSYLIDYEEIDGGYVAFRGNPKGWKITRKRVAERRNKTLSKAARTMLTDSKLPTTFWAEAISIAFYVQNRVLVVKLHKKTPYEPFHGRTPILSFIRPFRCPVTILDTIDHLGKFDGKADEGFFIGYSLNSIAFRVLNSRTRIVEENLHIRFSKSTPNIVGSGLDWIFYINALTRTMNYEPIVVDPRNESEYKDQEKKDNVNSTNNVNTISNVNTVNDIGTNEVNVVHGKLSIELLFDPKIPTLEDDNIFDIASDDDAVELCIAFKRLMHEKFQMSSVGELTFFLGLQVQKKKDGIFICQDKYVAKILNKFGFIEVKTTSTSMETQKPLLKDEDGKEVDVHMYRPMIGSLMYLTSSRPDIMFAMFACARYQVNLKVSYLYVVKRIFRYLKVQPKLGLWYPKDSPFDLVAYTDRKSTTGGCQFLRCRLISWQCKK